MVFSGFCPVCHGLFLLDGVAPPYHRLGIWPMEGEAGIYNILIITIIFFVSLWIRLWKTRRIKCGVRGAGCQTRQGGGRCAVDEMVLIIINTIAYVLFGVVQVS